MLGEVPVALLQRQRLHRHCGNAIHRVEDAGPPWIRASCRHRHHSVRLHGGFDIRLIVPIVLGALTLAYLFSGFNYDLGIYDEGIIVYGAARVLDGQVPYRDFWSFYAPGSFYTLAVLFAAFGTQLLISRILHLLTTTALSLMVYWVAARLLATRYALFAWLCALLWLGSYRLLASPMIPALLLTFSSVLCFIQYTSGRRRVWLVLSGVLCGLSACFRYDTGAAVALSECLVMIPMALTLHRPHKEAPRQPLASIATLTLPYLLGLSAVVLPVSIALLRAVPFDELVYDFLTFPFKEYPNLRGLPFPNPLSDLHNLLSGAAPPVQCIRDAAYGMTFVFPVLVHIASAGKLAYLWVRSRAYWDDTRAPGLVLLTLIGLLFLSYMRVRPDFPHLLPITVTASILLAFLLAQLQHLVRFRRAAVCAVLLLALPGLCFPAAKRCGLIRQICRTPACPGPPLDRANGITLPAGAAPYAELVRFVRKTVPEGEVIFVGNIRHDVIHINDILFYFLAGRHSATRYHQLEPGSATVPAIQRRIIAEMQSHKVNYVILRNESASELEPEGPPTGSTLLDQFFRANYRSVKTYGQYSLWIRKS